MICLKILGVELLYLKYSDTFGFELFQIVGSGFLVFLFTFFNYMSFYPYFIPLFYILWYLQNPPPAVSSERMAIQKRASRDGENSIFPVPIGYKPDRSTS